MPTASEPAPISIVPPTRLLVTGSQSATTRLFARRPGGTNDWLLIYTVRGEAFFRHSAGEWKAGAGDIVLIAPRVPHDYGLSERHGCWQNTWAHFLPRPDCLDWLKWPEFAPGMMCLHLDGALRERVETELRFMDEAAHGAHRRREELATNALERVLLLCETVNPRHAEARRDPRIRKAIEILCRDLAQPFVLEDLARRCGLSRSRMAQLFRQQAGASPLAFLENRRLHRAAELMMHTTLSLGDIADQTGFSSPFYLSLRFKRKFGLSPREFRRQNPAGRATLCI